MMDFTGKLMSKKKQSITISRTLDLHGYTVQKAYEKTREFLDYCRDEEFNYVRVITGKSGQIHQEFLTWMETLGYELNEINVGSFVVKVL